MDTFSLFH